MSKTEEFYKNYNTKSDFQIRKSWHNPEVTRFHFTKEDLIEFAEAYAKHVVDVSDEEITNKKDRLKFGDEFNGIKRATPQEKYGFLKGVRWVIKEQLKRIG